MDWNDVKNVVGRLAPTIAAGLGGPLAGSAVAALTEVFGLNPNAPTAEKQEAIVAALAGATPDDLLAIKKADQEYALAMSKAGFENAEKLEALATNDRDSARKREIEVKDQTPRNMAYAITVGYFGMLVFIMLYPIPSESRDILNYMLGTLGTAWIAAVTYYYGSTKNSSEKTKLLAASTPTVAQK